MTENRLLFPYLPFNPDFPLLTIGSSGSMDFSHETDALVSFDYADIAALPLNTPTNLTTKGCGVPGFCYSFWCEGVACLSPAQAACLQ